MLELKRRLTNLELSVKEITYQPGFDEPANLLNSVANRRAYEIQADSINPFSLLSRLD